MAQRGHGEHDGSGSLPGRGRTIASPAFAGDDGAADGGIRALLRDGDDAALIAGLASARLLVAVVAVLDAVDEETGADKESSMAVVSMVNAAGEKGLLAFSGLDALQAWDPQARPVPVSAPMAAAAAIDDEAQALVIDVLGPARRVLGRASLTALAAMAESAQEPPGP